MEGGASERRMPQQALQKRDIHRHAIDVKLRQGALQSADGALEAARWVGSDKLGQQGVKAPAGRVTGVAERIDPNPRPAGGHKGAQGTDG